MRRARGFTLIEALVALAILAFGLMGSAALQLKALHSANRSYQHSVATLAAVDAQERLWEELGEVLKDDDEDKDCTDLKLRNVKPNWKVDWGENDPSNPLRNAKLDIDKEKDKEDCTYTITVELDNAENDDGYGEVSYTVRLPKKP